MVHNWEPGVQYNLGDSVMYNGSKYNIIQAHRSQGDWAPDRTPALWGKVPGGGGGGQHHQQPQQHCDPKPGHQQPQQQHHQQPGYQQPQQHQQQPGYQQPQQPGYQQQPPQQGGYKPVEVQKPDVHIHEEEKKTSWFDLSDERKKQLEIGGGIAAGAGLLGAGYLLWKKHDKDEDEKKDLMWGLQNWVTTAQERTQRYFQQGPSDPCTWLLVKGKQLPQGAIVGGEEGGQTVYIARAFIEGGIHIGKAHGHCNKGALIGYGGDEEDYDTYEVLVGDMRALRWVDIQGDFSIEKLHGARPVEGGKEKNGDSLYVVQATYKGETIPGKISKKINAHVCKDGKEREIKQSRVLCYA